MSLQRHPIDSFKKDLNFWEEFPDYKVHPTFSRIWSINRKNKLKESSLFMWALTLCYDRKSSFFSQPERDKWEVACEDLFGDAQVFADFSLCDDDKAENPFQDKAPVIDIPTSISFREIVIEFEKSIDSPLGITLRELERKLLERTKFIMDTPYSIDSFVTIEGAKGNKSTLVKGTADSLDRMFANTEKITALIQDAMNSLSSSDESNTTKGGGKASLGESKSDF